MTGVDRPDPSPTDVDASEHGEPAPAWAKALLVAAPFVLALLVVLAFRFFMG